MKKPLLALSLLFAVTRYASAQCVVNPANVYAFSTNGQSYEIVKENLNWVDAAACAVARGGQLAEIDSQAEQDSLFTYIYRAGIVASRTIAPDGGQSSYLWLGGNDLGTEGTWVWNGNNDAATTPFWQGTAAGSPIGGRFSNWGNEPDDFLEQDCLGWGFTNWLRGQAGEWNDIDASNTLYYIIEYAAATPVAKPKPAAFACYPNPAQGVITVEFPEQIAATPYSITDQLGRPVLTGKLTAAKSRIDISALPAGMYLFVAEGQRRQAFSVVR